MKKLCVIILFLSLVLCSCTADTSKNIEVHSYSLDYLSFLGVKDSELKNIDFEPISAFKFDMKYRDLSYVSNNIDEVLEPFYKIISKKNNKIDYGDVISMDILARNNQGDILFVTKNVKVLIGYDYYGQGVDDLLVNAKHQNMIVIPSNLHIKGIFQCEDIHEIHATITGVFSYIEKDDTPQFLRENDFESFCDFYDYLFNMKISESDYEKKAELIEKFVEHSIKYCEFSITEEDILIVSEGILSNHNNFAESFNLPLDDYYEDVLSLSEDEFFVMCATSAEKEIQQCLIFGALATKYKINISDDKFKQFCENYDYDTSDTELMIRARYYCMVDHVISFVSNDKTN